MSRDRRALLQEGLMNFPFDLMGEARGHHSRARRRERGGRQGWLGVLVRRDACAFERRRSGRAEGRAGPVLYSVACGGSSTCARGPVAVRWIAQPKTFPRSIGPRGNAAHFFSGICKNLILPIVVTESCVWLQCGYTASTPYHDSTARSLTLPVLGVCTVLVGAICTVVPSRL